MSIKTIVYSISVHRGVHKIDEIGINLPPFGEQENH